MQHSPRLCLLLMSLLWVGACRSKPAPGDQDSGSSSAAEQGDDAGDITDGELVDSGDPGTDGDGVDGGAGDEGTDGGTGEDGSGDAGSGDGSSGDGDGGDAGSGDGGTGDEGADGGSGDSGSGDSGSGEDGGDSDGSGTGTAVTELCNGIDDDGDGEIDEGACPEIVVTDPVTGRAYMMVATHMDWPDAEANCATYGYTLVTIDDAAENELVWELIYEGDDGVGHIDAHTWIGYHEPVGDSWAWDGPSTSYENFDSEVITDGYGSTYFGQAAAFGDSDDQYWHEAPMTWRYASVCEAP